LKRRAEQEWQPRPELSVSVVMREDIMNAKLYPSAIVQRTATECYEKTFYTFHSLSSG